MVVSSRLLHQQHVYVWGIMNNYKVRSHRDVSSIHIHDIVWNIVNGRL